MDSEAGKKIEVPKDVGEIVIPKACDGGGGGVCVKREGRVKTSKLVKMIIVHKSEKKCR